MARCLQKFLLQAHTSVSTCQEKKGSVRTKRIEAVYTKSGGASLGEGEKGRGEEREMRRGGDEERGIAGEGEMGRGGDGERGRLKDEEMRRGGDEESPRAGEREMRRLGKFLFLSSPFFLLPSSDFHRTDIRYIRYIR
ncbi:hypothetical protein [Microcoleus sp. T3B2]|uniref:hypothetical protein n=1 Tax=Microcoleus sp. T3B2 TaxID=3055426 RepID=UPI002FD300B0